MSLVSGMVTIWLISCITLERAWVIFCIMHAKPHRSSISSISSISTRVHVSMCPRVLAQDVDAQDAVCDDPGLDHGRLGGAAASVRVEQVGRIFCENNNREC